MYTPVPSSSCPDWSSNSDQLPINSAGDQASGENTIIVVPQRAQPRRRLLDPQPPGPSPVNRSEAVDARSNRLASAPPDDHRDTQNNNDPGPSIHTGPGLSKLADDPSAPTSQSYDAVRALLSIGNQRAPDPSDATEDSSAYAETLEGGKNREDGCVPFYPGKHP